MASLVPSHLRLEKFEFFSTDVDFHFVTISPDDTECKTHSHLSKNSLKNNVIQFLHLFFFGP